MNCEKCRTNCERCKVKKVDIIDSGSLLCARCYLDKHKKGTYNEQRHKTFGRL